MARIRAIRRRTLTAGPEPLHAALSIGMLTLWPEQRRAEWDGQPLELTSTEFNLLEILARNAGRPVSKSELSEQGLGRQLARFDRNIDVHLSSIRHKLGTLPDGTAWDGYRVALADACRKLADYAPDAIVVSLGVDTFKHDPISQFKLDNHDYLCMGEAIAGVGKPTLFVMEGGYMVDDIGVNAVNVLLGFEGRG